MGDEDDPKGYRWETEYEKTWEALQEDEKGFLQPGVEEFVHRTKRQRFLEKKNIRLGMMRHLYVVIDFSECMNEPDLKPTRRLCTLKLLEEFVKEYFDQNPISQLGFITTKNKRASKLTELGGNPKHHINALKNSAEVACVGEPSIQNSLEIAAQTLRYMPSHTSREVLIILGSLTTCDPSNIYSTIENLKTCSIRCSVIGLAAELRVCRALSKATGGTYNIIMDESHFRELINQQTVPPPAANKFFFGYHNTAEVTGLKHLLPVNVRIACTYRWLSNAESSLIRMGFPRHQTETEGKPSMCMCHLDSKDPSEGFGSAGYYCPQCLAKYCELPVECKACGLTLVSAPHLARSYHHLFPLNCFQEVSVDKLTEKDPRHCYSCLAPFNEQLVYQCKNCSNLFCLECDLFVHETLHTCPGCSSTHLLDS